MSLWLQVNCVPLVSMSLFISYSLLHSLSCSPFPLLFSVSVSLLFSLPSLLFFLRRYSLDVLDNDNELFLYDFITFFIDYLFDLNILVCSNYIPMFALQTLFQHEILKLNKYLLKYIYSEQILYVKIDSYMDIKITRFAKQPQECNSSKPKCLNQTSNQ